MSDEKLSLEVVAPEKMVMTKTVDMVTISGTEGDFGVLPGHAALVSSIRPGFLEIEVDKQSETMFIGGGFIEVIEDRVSILASEVLSSEQINISECEEKISKYTIDLGASETDADKDIIQKSIDKYQAMIEFKNSN
ncbi:MAG: ATP synthase epsilon chain [Alphaproteobacteria bacterium MarineAlpha9_Bin3]|nr:MAG: ATP synthase epsilon chain [Alphaproteobacteria bacterium MarineAlpha9_Bin3]|tara:strand:- start:6729 stop:7136 length:408 start_codon:yes stop_codon:yes gene_type:complete